MEVFRIKNELKILDNQIRLLEERRKAINAGRFRIFLATLDIQDISGIEKDSKFYSYYEEVSDKIALELHELKQKRQRLRKLLRSN